MFPPFYWSNKILHYITSSNYPVEISLPQASGRDCRSLFQLAQSMRGPENEQRKLPEILSSPGSACYSASSTEALEPLVPSSYCFLGFQGLLPDAQAEDCGSLNVNDQGGNLQWNRDSLWDFYSKTRRSQMTNTTTSFRHATALQWGAPFLSLAILDFVSSLHFCFFLLLAQPSHTLSLSSSGLSFQRSQQPWHQQFPNGTFKRKPNALSAWSISQTQWA